MKVAERKKGEPKRIRGLLPIGKRGRQGRKFNGILTMGKEIYPEREKVRDSAGGKTLKQKKKYGPNAVL